MYVWTGGKESGTVKEERGREREEGRWGGTDGRTEGGREKEGGRESEGVSERMLKCLVR